MLAFYIFSLSVAAGFIGSLVRHAFTQLGYIPGFTSGLYITLGAAGLFAGIQLLYLTVLRIYQPSRAPAALACEGCSNLAAFLLIPALLDISAPGLPDNMSRLAPLIYLGVFGVVHLFFKLASFYAALTGPRDAERPILVWMGAAVLTGLAGGFGLMGWQRSVESARVVADNPEVLTSIGGEFARARAVPEGATLSGAMEPRDAPTMALRFANIEPDLREGAPVGRVYATVTLVGRDTKVYQTSAATRDDGWAEILVPTEFFPADATRYHVYWTRDREPNWQRILRMRPIVYNLPEEPGATVPPAAEVYVSGPSIYVERPAAAGLSLLVVLVDGLAADHLSLFGYERDVTPSMDRLGFRANLFPNTVARGASTKSGLAALLTGRDPAAMDGGARVQTTLPDTLRLAGYATAAFFEVAPGETYHDADWATGFEIFGERIYPGEDGPDNSATTLAAAREWISRHQELPFFCLVRLRTLADLPGPDFPVDREFKGRDGAVRDVDRFDSAVVGLDKQLGALFKYIRDYETRSNTCIVLTSTYGYEFSPGESRKFSATPLERVPLIVETPERRQLKHPKEAGLQDLAATLAGLAEVRLPGTVEGVNLLP